MKKGKSNKSKSNKSQKIRKQKARISKERRNKRKQRRRNNSKNKQRQAITTVSPLNCDKDKAFKEFKNASDYTKRIDRIIKFVSQLKKKANVTNSPIQYFAEMLATATNKGTTCTPQAQNAYKFLQSCLETIPTLCSSLDIDIPEAKECTNQATSSFANFFKCAKPLNKDLCGCYMKIKPNIPAKCVAIDAQIADVTNNRKLCLNATVTGSFSNCMQFIKTQVPMIIDKCFVSENCSTTAKPSTSSTTSSELSPSPNSSVPTTTTTTTRPSTGVPTTAGPTASEPTTSTDQTTVSPTTIPTTSQSSKVNSTTVFVEGDVVVEQIESYDPNTKELSVSVPAHMDREAITMIYGETLMVTAFNAYCIIGDRPDDFNTSFYETPKTKNLTPLNSSDVQSVYIFNVIDDEKEMTDDEKESLPESFKTLCESKIISKSSRSNVNETVFEHSDIFNETLLDSAGSRTFRSKRGLRDKVNTFYPSLNSNPNLIKFR